MSEYIELKNEYIKRSKEMNNQIIEKQLILNRINAELHLLK